MTRKAPVIAHPMKPHIALWNTGVNIEITLLIPQTSGKVMSNLNNYSGFPTGKSTGN